MSASPCWRRIKRLEDTGFIRKRVTLLDAEKLGLDFEVYAIVKLSLPSRENLDTFEAAVSHWPEVVQCATITGREDYVLRIITSDMHAFDKFLRCRNQVSPGTLGNIHAGIRHPDDRDSRLRRC